MACHMNAEGSHGTRSYELRLEKRALQFYSFAYPCLLCPCRLVMRIPALADIQVKRIEPEDGGPASWLLTKRHFAYEQALSQYDQRCALLRSLQDLLLPCLVLAVPRSSSSSLARLGGAVGGTQPPPAKVRRRSSSRR